MSETTFSRDQLAAANEDAAAFYRRHLLGPDGDGPRRYLAGRGFEAVLDDTVWTVGHAPAGWTALHDHLSELGYSDECQLAAGLISISRRGEPIDRFRNKITFGIRDHGDELVGFTARKAPDSHGPKYLNTPKTNLFDKSAVLFGLGETTRSPATSHVLVEGPLDAIAVHIAAPHAYDALALCGTALTPEHANVLRTLNAERLILAFDADPAGARALENTTIALNDHHVLALHDRASGDPAKVLEEKGPEGLSQGLARARPAIEVLLDLHLERWPNRRENAEAALGCLRETARMVGRIKPREVASLAARLSTETGMAPATVTYELHEAFEHHQVQQELGHCEQRQTVRDRNHAQVPRPDRFPLSSR